MGKITEVLDFKDQLEEALPDGFVTKAGPYLKAISGAIVALIAVLTEINQAVEAAAVIATVYVVPNLDKPSAADES